MPTETEINREKVRRWFANPVIQKNLNAKPPSTPDTRWYEDHVELTDVEVGKVVEICRSIFRSLHPD